jgi:hypothetical protein
MKITDIIVFFTVFICACDTCYHVPGKVLLELDHTDLRKVVVELPDKSQRVEYESTAKVGSIVDVTVCR